MVFHEVKIQWNLHQEATPFANKKWPLIGGGLSMEVLLVSNMNCVTIMLKLFYVRYVIYTCMIS